jgi:RNA ligase
MIAEFPSIPCLFRALDRKDEVVNLTERTYTPCWIQEKVDGANIGFGLLDKQLVLRNRNYILNKTFRGKTAETQQFQSTWQWLSEHKLALKELNKLGKDEFVVYGEWMLLTHNIKYVSLPSLVLAYKLRSHTTGQWIATEKAQSLFELSGLPYIKAVRSVFNAEALASELNTHSAYGTEFKEGLVLTFDDGVTAKLHHPSFVRNGLPLDMANRNTV